jgi:putative glycerol-1-phosphate prenyltransferase
MKQELHSKLVEKKKLGKKSFAVLIDPDKINEQSLTQTIDIAVKSKVDYFFVGEEMEKTNCFFLIESKLLKQGLDISANNIYD